MRLSLVVLLLAMSACKITPPDYYCPQGTPPDRCACDVDSGMCHRPDGSTVTP